MPLHPTSPKFPMMKPRHLLALVLLAAPSAFAEEEKLDLQVVEPQKKTAPTVQFDATTITASEEKLHLTGGSVHLLDAETLAQFRYDDIHRVLSQVPGVYIREEDGYGLRPNIGFRGADSNRSKKIALMEDGVLFGPAPYSAPAAYYFPMVGRMNGVEVFKGPSSIQYGPNTIGGAINLQTRPIPFEREGGVELSIGSDAFAKGAFHYGSRSGQWGFVLDLIHLRSDGFKELDGGEDTGFEKTEGMIKVQWESDVKAKNYQRVSLKLGHSEEESHETYLGLSDDDFRANPWRRYGISQDDLMDWDRQQIVLSHFIDINEWVQLNTQAYRHTFSRSWAKVNSFGDGTEFLDILDGTANNAAAYYDVLDGTADSGVLVPNILYDDNQRDYVSEGVQLDGSWIIESDVEQVLNFGIRWHRDEIERNHDETTTTFVGGDMRPIAGTTVDTRINKDETDAISAYLLHEVSWGAWNISPGLRLESMDMTSTNELTGTSTDRQDTVFLPGLGSSYVVDENWTILAGVHQGFSPVSPGQNEDIEEEESVNYELGARYQKNSFRAELIGFFNDYSNLLGEATLSTGATPLTVGTQYNGGEVDVLGLEFVIENEWQLSHGTLPFKLNYTYTDAEFKTTFGSSLYGFDRDPTDGLADDDIVISGEPIPYVPEHLLQFDLGWHVAKWQVHLAGKHQSKMREIASEDETDSYWLFDLSTRYQWNERSVVLLKIDNLFEEEYIASRRPYGARPGKPRQWQLGAEFRF